jgi:hypothetical protein
MCLHACMWGHTAMHMLLTRCAIPQWHSGCVTNRLPTQGPRPQSGTETTKRTPRQHGSIADPHKEASRTCMHTRFVSCSPSPVGLSGEKSRKQPILLSASSTCQAFMVR